MSFPWFLIMHIVVLVIAYEILRWARTIGEKKALIWANTFNAFAIFFLVFQSKSVSGVFWSVIYLIFLVLERLYPRRPVDYHSYENFRGSMNFHAIHHLKQKNVSNFGEIFVFWDVIFGTFERKKILPEDQFGDEDWSSEKTNYLSEHLIPWVSRK